ncbi:phosphatidylinositol 4-phosphate 5-kinase-like protein 1 [Periophthalmus magnuspinnatus]|uniref:phosphatidylinositol 4-phosphate 5-kinase-like protein 1 n=1 Tax=Periophthalmus magnuspinnatus TaxID=409849 RepID=UPI00145AFFE1|nr:phosphatidylinositol 4-phosphate 5-kinase-like protein 1 [Periophthalmus magnuspinnatus]
MADSTVSRAARRRRRWWHLRQQWSMLGVFEISADHEFFRLTTFIKEGTRVSIQKGVVSDRPSGLTEEDYRKKEQQTHKGFSMETFAAPVFRFLRCSVGISEEQYLDSLCSDQCYVQFISNSKSKADFFVTHDKRFFLKTQSRREVQFLLNKLKAYVQHLEKNPHSIMVRFMGVYKIIIPNEMKKYFIVMQSVFFPDERIDIRYDLKGCEVGRWTDPDTKGKHIIKVLKDNNFQEHITLGPEKSWFVEQVRADVEFLRGLNVLDYSLLLAHQPLHQDELQGRHSLANLVLRTTKSLDMDSPSEANEPTAPLLSQNRTSPETDSGPNPGPDPGVDLGGASSDPDALPLAPLSLPSGLRDFGEHHRRLLPNCENAVHVIDGEDKRYFVGIIDIFTVYGCKKRLESLWKTLRFPGRSFSTVSPGKYSARFCQWIQGRTK